MILNKNKKENNFIDISSDKQAKPDTRRLGYGQEKETLKEKSNIFK